MGLDRLLFPMLDGQPTGWFAPSYKYLNDPWRTMLTYVNPVVGKVSTQERRIELITGGSVDFWTLEDADAGRGRKYSRVVIDEAAKVKDLGHIWFNAIRPTLVDLKGGADFLSTPKGMDFFWQCFNRGQDPAEPEWASWCMPTSTNPYIPADEIEAARRGMPERAFQQEMLAMFLTDSGGVFRHVRESVDVDRTQPDHPQPGNYYSVGVDLARVEDFTVITVLDGNGRQVYHERFNQISWERQMASIRAVAGRYPGRVVVDSTGIGDPICEALRRSGVDLVTYHFTSQSKEAAIDRLAMYLEQGRLRLMDVSSQTNELLAFEYQLTPSRNVRMSAPEGQHDDCVIALSLAAWGLTRYAYAAPTEAEIDWDASVAADAARRATSESDVKDIFFGGGP
jgi:hypothetical protein